MGRTTSEASHAWQRDVRTHPDCLLLREFETPVLGCSVVARATNARLESSNAELNVDCIVDDQ